MKIPEKPIHVFGLLALAVGVMLHANLSAPFNTLDDLKYLKLVAKRSWLDQFKPEPRVHYVPITYLSFKLDMAIVGVDPDYFLLAAEHDLAGRVGVGGEAASEPTGDAQQQQALQELVDNAVNWAWFPRLMNGIYHACAAFLLWLFLTRIGAGAGVSLFTAFVWAAHPMAQESVAWVCERKNTMCALWSFATLLAWTVPAEKKWRWPLMWGLFTLAVYSKLAALSVIPILCALEFFDPPRREFDWRRMTCWLRSFARLSGIVILAVGCVIHAMSHFEGEIVHPPGGSAWTGLLTDSEIFARYTLNTVWPFGLSFSYGIDPILSLADVRFWKYGLPLLLFWGVLFHFARRDERYWIAFGFICFFGALGPNANIIATAFPMQDRYVYLPMPGLVLALAYGGRGLMEALGAIRYVSAAGLAFATFILILCGLRSPVFADSFEAIRRAAQNEPKSRFATVNWAMLNARELNKAKLGERSERLKAYAEEVVSYSLAAELCNADIPFVSNSILRVERARALVYLNRESEALETLKPLLVLKQSLAASSEVQNKESEQAKVSRRENLWASSEAWRMSSELLLKRASNTQKTTEERLANALQSAEYTMAYREFFPAEIEKMQNYIARAKYMRGQALLVASQLAVESGKRAEAKRLFSEARQELQSIDKKFKSGRDAEQLLKSAREPE